MRSLPLMKHTLSPLQRLRPRIEVTYEAVILCIPCGHNAKFLNGTVGVIYRVPGSQVSKQIISRNPFIVQKSGFHRCKVELSNFISDCYLPY
jgi:hypothetical protein